MSELTPIDPSMLSPEDQANFLQSDEQSVAETDDILTVENQKNEHKDSEEYSEIDFSDFFKFYDKVMQRFEEGQTPFELTTMEQYLEKDGRLRALLTDQNFIIYAAGVLIAQTVMSEDNREFSLNMLHDNEAAQSSELGMLQSLKRADFFLKIAKGSSLSNAYNQTNNWAKDRLCDALNFAYGYRSGGNENNTGLSNIENATYANIETYVKKYYDDEESAKVIIEKWKALSQKYLDRINKYLAKDSH